MELKYCWLCKGWIYSRFISDDDIWIFNCGHESSRKAQEIINIERR